MKAAPAWFTWVLLVGASQPWPKAAAPSSKVQHHMQGVLTALSSKFMTAELNTPYRLCELEQQMGPHPADHEEAVASAFLFVCLFFLDILVALVF